MKFWILFVVGSFVAANFTVNLPAKVKQWIMIGIMIFVFCGYYFWKQI
jgi:hypothetical protein